MAHGISDLQRILKPTPLSGIHLFICNPEIVPIIHNHVYKVQFRRFKISNENGFVEKYHFRGKERDTRW